MGKNNRNSKHVIENDVKFIDEILGAIKRQDLQGAKCMLEDWKHELENVHAPRPEHSCIRIIIKYIQNICSFC